MMRFEVWYTPPLVYGFFNPFYSLFPDLRGWPQWRSYVVFPEQKHD